MPSPCSWPRLLSAEVPPLCCRRACIAMLSLACARFSSGPIAPLLKQHQRRYLRFHRCTQRVIAPWVLSGPSLLRYCVVWHTAMKLLLQTCAMSCRRSLHSVFAVVRGHPPLKPRTPDVPSSLSICVGLGGARDLRSSATTCAPRLFFLNLFYCPICALSLRLGDIIITLITMQAQRAFPRHPFVPASLLRSLQSHHLT